MNMQNVKDLSITEGDVRTIHDSNGNLLWGRLAYDTKYAGDTVQDGTPSPDTPVPVQVVTGTQTVTITADDQQSEDFTVSLGSLELCKIGDYEDYIYKSGDDWYVHKATNSIVLNGSSEGYWYRNNNVTGADIYGFQLNPPFPNVALKNTGVLGYLSDLFISLAASQWNANIEGLVQMNDKAFQIHILRSRLADGTRDTFIAWLSTHNTKLYYALATPTDTKITDATLIGQLNAIHEWLTRYGYNSTVSGNLPLVINQTNLA